MDKFELGFIIGLVEGEGSITLGKGICKNPQGFSLHPRFFITNTDMMLLKKAQLIIGGKIFKKEKIQKINHKQGFKLCIDERNELKTLLLKLEPYLISKRKHCQLLLKYLNIHIPNGRKGYSIQELKIFEKIKKLNQLGIEMSLTLTTKRRKYHIKRKMTIGKLLKQRSIIL